MQRIWKPVLIAVFYGCVLPAFVYSYDFGPRPLFYVISQEQGSRVSGMYTYQNLVFNAITLEGMSLGGVEVADTDDYNPFDSIRPHHQLNVSTNLLFGVDTAISYMTNQFNEAQDDTLPYDEFNTNVNIPLADNDRSLYAGYRTVRQNTRTYYEVPHQNGAVEDLEYDTRLDVAKIGYIHNDILDNKDIEDINMAGIEVYAGVTYIRLDTALPVIGETGELTASPFNSHTLGLSLNASITELFGDDPRPEDDFFLPYYTLGFAGTIAGITRMDNEWGYGIGFGPASIGEGILDGSFEVGVGAFLMRTVRFDANVSFNGVSMNLERDEGEYQQLLGKTGLGLSVELQL